MENALYFPRNGKGMRVFQTETAKARESEEAQKVEMSSMG